MLRADYTRGNFSLKTTLFIHSTAHTYHKVDGEMRKAMYFTDNIGGMDTEMSKHPFQRL